MLQVCLCLDVILTLSAIKKKTHRIFVISTHILHIFGINIFFLFAWCIADILDFEEAETNLLNIPVHVFTYKNEDVFKLNGLEIPASWIFQ